MNIETGTNITGLGYTWLGLHYLLPVIIGIALITIGAVAAYAIYKRYQSTTLPKEMLALLAAVGLIMIMMLK